MVHWQVMDYKVKILLYGFKRYGKNKINISEEIIKKIPSRKNLKKLIFPVVFERNIFLKAVEDFKPDLILGLGQYPRGKKIRIERKAINLKGTKIKGYQLIAKNGPKFRSVNWRFKKDRNSRLSYNAGKFVCNFSMYVLLGWLRKNQTKFAFLHVPKDFKVDLAVRFLSKEIYEFS